MTTIPMETLAPTKNQRKTKNRSFRDAVSFVFHLFSPSVCFSGYGRSSMGPLFTWQEED